MLIPGACRDEKGWSALMLASRTFYGDEMISPLLAKGADSNAVKSVCRLDRHRVFSWEQTTLALPRWGYAESF